jgi:hypothetical protein
MNPVYVKDVYTSARAASVVVRADDPMEYVLQQLARWE